MTVSGHDPSRMFTNLTYPLPLYLAPVNIFLAIYFIFFIMTVPKRRQVDAARREAGLSGSVLSTPGTGGRGNIHASLAELEYPHVPNPNTLFAGPILSPVSAEWDASSSEMAQFLAVGKTVLINLGSLFSYTEDDVTAIARAIVNVQSRLRDRKGFRVLWKLPQKSRFKAILEDILVVDRANVQITEWIESPVIVVLQHPNVVAVVHHGGASASKQEHSEHPLTTHVAQTRSSRRPTPASRKSSSRRGSIYTRSLCVRSGSASASTRTRAQSPASIRGS
jgi:hypothetical protein